MSDKFDILINDLERLSANGAVGVFGEESHSYQTHSPLTDDVVSEFERQQGVALPGDYRQFLLRVGNGGAGPYYGLFRLGEMDDGFDFGPWGDFVGQLSAPFPHTSAWNDVADKPEYQGSGGEGAGWIVCWVMAWPLVVAAFVMGGDPPFLFWLPLMLVGGLFWAAAIEAAAALIRRTRKGLTNGRHWTRR